MDIIKITELIEEMKKIIILIRQIKNNNKVKKDDKIVVFVYTTITNLNILSNYIIHLSKIFIVYFKHVDNICDHNAISVSNNTSINVYLTRN
jgi:hypothetical protein